jgi:hypothetical protein
VGDVGLAWGIHAGESGTVTSQGFVAQESRKLGVQWERARPHILVVACSDGRLQEATDAFLALELGVRHYDRLYVPGGAGGLASCGGRELLRAVEVRKDCRFLVEAHQVEELVLLFHGPGEHGPAESVCADYRRKQPVARVEEIRIQQERDVEELLANRGEFAGEARLSVYRFAVDESEGLSVETLHED